MNLFPILLNTFFIYKVKSESDRNYVNTQQILNAIWLKNNETSCGKFLKNILQFSDAKSRSSSSSELRWGIVQETNDFGLYDDCLATSSNISPKYCLLLAKFLSPKTNQKGFQHIFAVCLPEKCTNEQIFNGLHKEWNGSVVFDIYRCLTKSENEFSAVDWFALSLIVLILIISIFATLCKGHFLCSFSISENLRGVIKTSKEGTITCIYGLRIFSLLYIMMSHTFNSYEFFASNPDAINKAWRNPLYAGVHNARLAVETFFFISGLLAVISFFTVMRKKSCYDVPKSIIHRYFRLTPPLAFLVLFVVSLYKFLGSGPIWGDSNVFSNRENCGKYWWNTLLYIQNFTNMTEWCLIQSWYLCVDMQIFILSPLLFFAMHKFPRVALALPTFFTVTITIGEFYFALIHHLQPMPKLTIELEMIVRASLIDLTQMYSRAPAWLVGVILGYILFSHQTDRTTNRLTKTQIRLGWSIAILSGTTIVFSYVYYQISNYGALEGAVFLVFNRVTWPAVLGWVVYACINGYGGVINDVLSWKIFEPLAKISFSAYIVHNLLCDFINENLKTPQYFSYFNLIFRWFGVITGGFIAGFLLYLFIEAPFIKLEKVLLNDISILPWPRVRKQEESEVNQK